MRPPPRPPKYLGKNQETLDVEMACWMTLSDLAEACARELRAAGFSVSPPGPYSVGRNINFSIHVAHDPADCRFVPHKRRVSGIFILNIEIRDEEAVFQADVFGSTKNMSMASKATPEAIMDMIEAIKPAELVTGFIPTLRKVVPPPGPKHWMPCRKAR